MAFDSKAITDYINTHGINFVDAPYQDEQLYQPNPSANVLGYNLNKGNDSFYYMNIPGTENFLDFKRDPQTGLFSSSVKEPGGGGWFDNALNWVGDNVLPAATIGAIALISGGAAAGAMGGAGAGAGAGAEGGAAGAGTAGGGLADAGTVGASGAAGTTALPAGGMAATGSLAPIGADFGGLGSGMYGTGDAAMGATLGTSGGAFPLGSGLSGVTAADLGAAGSESSWLSTAQKLAKALKSSPTGSSTPQSVMPSMGGYGGTQGNSMQSPQAINMMPNFSISPGQNSSTDELRNSANIRLLAQGLRNGY